MSNIAIARLLGFCVLIVGLCTLTLVGFSIVGFFSLVLAIVLGLIKVALTLGALGFTLVGFVWVLSPKRAIETVVRNREHRQMIRDTKRD